MLVVVHTGLLSVWNWWLWERNGEDKLTYRLQGFKKKYFIFIDLILERIQLKFLQKQNSRSD